MNEVSRGETGRRMERHVSGSKAGWSRRER